MRTKADVLPNTEWYLQDGSLIGGTILPLADCIYPASVMPERVEDNDGTSPGHRRVSRLERPRSPRAGAVSLCTPWLRGDTRKPPRFPSAACRCVAFAWRFAASSGVERSCAYRAMGRTASRRFPVRCQCVGPTIPD